MSRHAKRSGSWSTSVLASLLHSQGNGREDPHSGTSISLRFLKAGGAETYPHTLAKRGRLEELQQLLEQGEGLLATDDGGPTLLHSAVETNQVTVMEYLIGRGTDMNATDGNGNTPLHIAIQNGHIEAMHLLLNSGACDTIRNHHHHPPLHLAISRTDTALVGGFLEHPVDILVKGYRSRTFMHVVAEHDNIEALKLIHDSPHLKQDRQLYLSAFDEDDLTPVHLAAQKGAHQVLEFLLEKMLEYGIRPEVALSFLDEENRTPTQFAVESGDTKVLELLLKYGASPTLTKGDHLPPLHTACYQGKLDMVLAMLQTCGSDILQSQDQEGKVALHHSTASIRSEQLIPCLLQWGAKLNMLDSYGFTPLHTAIVAGNLEAVKELLQKGSDPTMKTQNGCNALHIAVERNRDEVVRCLLAHPSAPFLVSDPDKDGNIPLHCALEHSLCDLVMLMIQSVITHHENINLKDRNSNNYLHLAASSGDFRTLSKLLELPSTHMMINEVNKSGSTPLHSAAYGGNLACINMLVNHGAIVHKCHSGQTPFMYACSSGNLDPARALYNAHTFQRDWVDDDGNTALHLSAESGNPAVVQLCLDVGTSITPNKTGDSFFDIILHRVDGDMASVALSHHRWQECLDNCSAQKPHPILRLIERIPEAAFVIFDRSYTKSHLDSKHPDYWEEFDFKYVRLRPGATDSLGSSNPVHTTSGDGNFEVEPTSSHAPSSLKIKPAGITHKRREPPLEVLHWLVKYKRTYCLHHPLIVAYLKTKWRDYAQMIYLLPIALMTLLAVFLTIFIGITPPPTQTLSTVDSGNGTLAGDKNNIGTASNVIRFITLFICLLNTFIWVFFLYMFKWKALNFIENLWLWADTITIVCTYIFLIPWRGLDSVIWEAGALAVFFSWFLFFDRLQLIGIVGIYVTMFLKVTKTVFQVLVVGFVLMLAFALPFYILVGDLDGLPFSSIGFSLYTVFNYMLAVINFTDFTILSASGALDFNVLVFLFLILVWILLPIVMINLLIGLAVGDIQRIQEEATINQRDVQVHVLRLIDGYVMSEHLLKRFERATYKHFPNAQRSWMRVAWHAIWRTLKSGIYSYVLMKCN